MAYHFSEIKLFGSFEIKCNILQVLLIKSPTEATKKVFFDFIRQRIASLQSYGDLYGSTSDVTVTPLAHHPILFAIFRYWMGFIKGQCNNRRQLYFYHEAITFLRKTQAPIWSFCPRGIVFF